ncbi:MAG: hypothetical protein WBD87_12155 [Candidatus Acidiferrales bacterium]
MKRMFLLLVLISAIGLIPRFAFAQSGDAANDKVYQDAIQRLAFRSIGPASMDGRIDAFAVPRHDPNTIYVASATGGVWKSTNRGTTWTPIFDQQPVSSIGAIEIAPSDPSIVWVGTGEANNRQTSSWGDGVYKSTDAGATWTHMGLSDSFQISRIVIDPANPQIVYVAALGNLWGPGGERGLYKTKDGGKTWQRVLYQDENTGIADVEMNPQSSQTLFASAYERRRTVFGMNGGGPSSALYKTTDGGATWRKLSKGLPYEHGTVDTGRIGVSIYPRDPRIMYARVESADNSGVFCSMDGGETWEKRSSVDPRPSYFSQILVDPNNYLRIWLPGGGLAHSDDGGKTFLPDPDKQGLQTIHADFHAVWIDPDDSNYMITGSDGGVYISHDAGDKWDYVNTIPVGQVYAVATDTETPYHICGGFQDNGSWCGPVRTRSPKGIMNSDWSRVMDGDGFQVVPDPKDSNIVFVEGQNGKLIRLNRRTNEWALIRPMPEKLSGPPYRWQWNSPLVASAQGNLYSAANYLFKSTDQGNTWTTISPDLTTNIDPAKLSILGEAPAAKKMIERDYGAGTYPCITALSVSEKSERVIWVGTEDGNLQVTRDGGQTWSNVIGSNGLPKGVYVSYVNASPVSEGTAYVTFDGHRNGDFGIYVFRTDDYGKTWQKITTGLPDNRGTAQVIREDPYNRKLLFVGTEFGLFVSFDRGDSWSALKLNFPSVIVDDITIERRSHDLILATHGRAFWVLDDIRSLEQLTPSVLSSPLHLFDIQPAREWKIFDHSNGYTGDQLFMAPNPPDGATIDYFLASTPQKGQTVQIRISDKEGKLIQEFPGTDDPGINRMNWDLRYPTPVKPTQDQLGAQDEGFFYNAIRGPLVAPGSYTVQVLVGNEKASETVEVLDDPTIQMSAQDRQARDGLIMQTYETYKRAVEAGKTIISLKKSLDDAQKQYPDMPKELKAQIQDFAKRVDQLHKQIVGPSEEMFVPLTYTPPPVRDQAGRLLFSLDNVSQAPTSTQRREFTEISSNIDSKVSELKTLVDTDLPKLNAAMAKAKIPYIPPPSAK